jgi:hypothetical protein
MIKHRQKRLDQGWKYYSCMIPGHLHEKMKQYFQKLKRENYLDWLPAIENDNDEQGKGN